MKTYRKLTGLLLGSLPALLAGSLLLAGGRPAAGAPISQTSLVLRSANGDAELRDGDLERGSAVVVLWASWSPKSRGIAERVQTISGQWSGQARIVAVNFQERPEEVAAFLRRNPFPIPVFLDPEGLFAKKYAVTTLPALLIFKEGRVVYAGKMPEDPGAVIREHLP
jgi:thiol-disulfide isomerase/thioredoxin